MPMNYARFMTAALEQAEAAYHAGEFPVGCVLVHKDRIVASGRRVGTTALSVNEVDHAEMVALRRLVVAGGNPPPAEMTLFSTLEPCLMCYGAAILSGIGTIVYAFEDVMGGGTGCDLTQLSPLYRTSGISIIPNVRRAESVKLLKAFFANPDNAYWKDSLLARYTLRQ
ncbi:MAG: nucleoside deaminase [Deltaproteobacteria bacterium]|nr:nucleoside deaminase [Deltaproteobacteria bacterium]